MAQLTVVASFRAKPGGEGRLRTMLDDLIAPTRAEAGCINYDLHAAADEPGTFLILETWADRPLWEAHMKAPHVAAFGQSNAEVMESSTLFAGYPV